MVTPVNETAEKLDKVPMCTGFSYKGVVAYKTDMDRETFHHWLASYGSAWTGRDPEAAASLYADDATYQVTPFDEPLRGRAAVYEYWAGVAKTEEKIQFDYEILAVTPDHGIARWWASFVRVPPGLETKLDGIFLISLDSGGRCRSLREWWHKRQ